MKLLYGGGGGGGIYYAPISVALITSNINALSYCKLLKLIILPFSPNWLITYSGVRQRASEIDSTEPIPFTLGMD